MALEDRITDLETRITHLDDTVEHLNRIVADQQEHITSLRSALRRALDEQHALKEAMQTDTGQEPPPPHY